MQGFAPIGAQGHWTLMLGDNAWLTVGVQISLKDVFPHQTQKIIFMVLIYIKLSIVSLKQDMALCSCTLNIFLADILTCDNKKIIKNVNDGSINLALW